MSVLQQFTNYSERPVPPPPPPPVPAATSLCQQPIEHVGEAAHSGPLWHSQWRVFTQHVLIDLPHWPPEGPRVFCYDRAAAPFLDEQTPIFEGLSTPGHIVQFRHTTWDISYQQARQDPALRALEQAYVVEERSAIPEFIKRNRLLEPLLEARGPLASAFGEEAVKKLTLVEDDEGSVTLFCLILVPGGLEEAMWALNSFDEGWWLARSHGAGGKLNFDFELI